jgi:DNA-binding response OmpR family regulator
VNEDPAAKATLLLLGEQPQSAWACALREAVAEWGVVDVATEGEATAAVARRGYDLVLVDAGGVWDAAALVRALRAERPGIRVAVVTASPTWKRAREALEAGSVDYFRKSLDRTALRAIIESVLALVPPLWPPKGDRP